MLVAFIFGACWVGLSFGETQKEIRQILRPKIVSVNRKPTGTAVYDICIAGVKDSEGKIYEAAFMAIPDKKCPAASSVSFEVRDEVILTDGGKTKVKDFVIPQDKYRDVYEYDKDVWQFAGTPLEVTVEIPSGGSNSVSGKDRIFIALVANRAGDRTMFLVCDDSSSISSAFDTRYRLEEPKVDESKLTRHSQQTRTTERPTHR